MDDIETLRLHLKVDRWHVFGGSWGSTLALAYAERFHGCVLSVVLRGIFLLRKKEIDWFYQDGASYIYPDAWEPYLNHIPAEERGDLVAAYHKRLTADDPQVRMAAARAWTLWEGATSKLLPNADFLSHFEDDHFAEAFARIECHYFFHRGFFEHDGQLLTDANKLADIPITIVQGRYDMVCPMTSAWDLHKALPHAEFIVVPDAGHSATEPGISRALVHACDKMSLFFDKKD